MSAAPEWLEGPRVAGLRLFWCAQRRYAQFEALRGVPGLRHAFATRPMDVSARRDASAGLRAANRAQMATDLGLAQDELCYCVQVHQTRLVRIDDASPRGAQEDCDALVTCRPGVPLMCFSADCPLLLLVDPLAGVLGLAHASWRCTVAQITMQLVGAMIALGAAPQRIRAGIGPSAGPQRYEVREDVYAAAAHLPQRERLFPYQDGRMCFDLWSANREQLLRAGVPAESVELAGVCTMSDSELFYSYRREGAGCGHFGLMAALV